MKSRFIGAVGVISNSLSDGRALFVDALRLPLRRAKGTHFLHSENLDGSKYFGVWPLSEAAKSCFGVETWPADRPVPQSFVEIEVESPAEVVRVASELKRRGYRLLHDPRTDPWGQTVARLQTETGLILGVSYVPWMHRPPKRRARSRSVVPKSRAVRRVPRRRP